MTDIKRPEMKPRQTERSRSGGRGGPEVLAPAGYFRCVERALDAGADAVYFGGRILPHMRSQGQAPNLSDAQVAQAIGQCHAAGARAYYTANSPYRARELAALEDGVAELVRLGIDAIIVSDLALLTRIRERFPDLFVWASVQLGATNARACEFLASVGANGVVLERSVTVEDAARIKERTGLPVELFVFGPHCASYDAACFMGQYFTGTVCKNSCMTRFVGGGAVEGRRRWLYMAFYNGLARVPDLVRYGIDGLKIEGRSRSSRYVKLATSVYREAVDAARAGSFAVEERWIATLAEAALHAALNSGFYGDVLDRDRPIASFSNRSRLGFVRELLIILKETGNLPGVLSEFELAASIDKLYQLKEEGANALRRVLRK